MPIPPPSLDLDVIAAQLQIPAEGRALCVDWDLAMQTGPVRGMPLLQPDFIGWAAQAVFLSDEMIREPIAFAPRVADDQFLRAFFWYCRYRVLNDVSLTASWEAPWPALDGYLGEEAGLLNVLVMLAAVPEMLAVYRRLNIPTDIYRDTISDLRLWLETDSYFQKYQRWGLTPWIARWLCHHWRGLILQLGRLQFSLGRFGGRLKVYRHRQTRQVRALSEAGLRYTPEGSMWRECCGDGSQTWISSFDQTSDIVAGNPVTPDGLAHPTPLSLPLADWELVLAHDADVLMFHIPAGTPMTFERCGDSFRRALEVFPRYYPDFPFRGFWTSTWLMDPRLPGLLPPESNIVRLQRELFIYPGLQGDNQQYYDRIFGWDTRDINQVEWKTSLQRAIGGYLNRGGHFHGGYGFLLGEDFDWGRQPYLRMQNGDPGRAEADSA